MHLHSSSDSDEEHPIIYQAQPLPQRTQVALPSRHSSEENLCVPVKPEETLDEVTCHDFAAKVRFEKHVDPSTAKTGYYLHLHIPGHDVTQREFYKRMDAKQDQLQAEHVALQKRYDALKKEYKQKKKSPINKKKSSNKKSKKASK